mmetsp:Transcript_12594/g.21187  ORF Transcript_12594/g.21187 Transcript_12594/m.21187 type:complete len:93 (-) Transcript_12594:578-856(-)
MLCEYVAEIGQHSTSILPRGPRDSLSIVEAEMMSQFTQNMHVDFFGGSNSDSLDSDEDEEDRYYPEQLPNEEARQEERQQQNNQILQLRQIS